MIRQDQLFERPAELASIGGFPAVASEHVMQEFRRGAPGTLYNPVEWE
jgi:hypothetical protein